MPRLTRSLLLAGLTIFAAACNKQPVPDGDVIAALGPLPTADDSPFSAETLRGKPTLVMFASPTCHYCMEELPIATKAAAAENANLVAVFIAGQKKHAASVTKTSGFTAPVLVDEARLLTKKYNIKGVPYLLVLGKDGHADSAFRGLQDEETLRDALDDAN